MTPLPSFGESTAMPQYKRGYNVKDEWGRLWLVYVETITGDLSGPPMSAGGWTDPIHIPPSYMRIDRNDPNRLIVDYEGWARELEAAWKDWQQRYEELGFDRYGEKFDPDDKPVPYMMRMVGVPPMDPKIPRAAAAGDPRYLGLTPKEGPRNVEQELRDEIAALKAEIERPAPDYETIGETSVEEEQE